MRSSARSPTAIAIEFELHTIAARTGMNGWRCRSGGAIISITSGAHPRARGEANRALPVVRIVWTGPGRATEKVIYGRRLPLLGRAGGNAQARGRRDPIAAAEQISQQERFGCGSCSDETAGREVVIPALARSRLDAGDLWVYTARQGARP